MSPLFERLWREYEAANTRARASYFAAMGHQRQIKDQSGRVRKTKQVR